MRELNSRVSYDAASALMQGKRAAQEDALVSDFQDGSDFGFLVLSDGMGGHDAGDVASRIIVTEVFGDIKRQTRNGGMSGENVADILSGAAMAANLRLRDHSAAHPKTAGMGATLLALILMSDRLFWISIGDSPLFLFRDGKLSQLNEDHSLAPQIDYLVKTGVISETEGRDHPDRNCLTSALLGEDIPRIDCSAEPFRLQSGDLAIAASDGLQFVSNSHIEQVLAANSGAPSTEIANALLAEIKKLDHPYQDNVGFTVVKIQDTADSHRCSRHTASARRESMRSSIGLS